MNKRYVWLLVATAAVGALLVGRWVLQRPSASSAKAPEMRALQAIELAAADVAFARQAELSRTLAVSGGLRAVQTAWVKAKVAAELKSLSVREGDRVSAGQLIGRLDVTEFQWRLRQAEDQVAAAQAQLDMAQRTLDNNKALVNQGFSSRNALDTSASSTAAAQAQLQAARAAAELTRKAVADSEIRAPISGLVSQRLAQPGERVGVDGRIVEIVDLSRIELEATLAPEDGILLRVGQQARITVDGLDQPLSARVVRINPSAQSSSRSVLAYLELAGGASAAGVRQGLFARGQIEVQRRQALVVPASALRFDQARPYLLTVKDGKALPRPVTPGTRGEILVDGQVVSAVEIVDGVEPGTPVLRASVGALREGTLIRLPNLPVAPVTSVVPAAPQVGKPAAAAASR